MNSLKRLFKKIKCFLKTSGFHKFDYIEKKVLGSFTIEVPGNGTMKNKTYRIAKFPIGNCKICGKSSDFYYERSSTQGLPG